MGLAWRRSLQLRVVTLTLGLSLAVILVLGFVLTSQITDRILEVKVRAATEEIERARNTVSGIVGGEETRSLDSSLQLARNTLIDRKADCRRRVWPAPSTRCWWCRGDGPARGDGGRPGRPGAQRAARLRQGRAGQLPVRDRAHRRLLRTCADHRQPDLVAGDQSRAVPDLPAEQRGVHHRAGARHHGHRRRGAAGPAGRRSRCWWRARSCCRCGRRRGSPNGSPKVT